MISQKRECPYWKAKGWHLYVPYRKASGQLGMVCHGCGLYLEDET